jgi:hypothetical protein
MTGEVEAERRRLHAELREAVANYEAVTSPTPLLDTESAVLQPGLALELQEREQAAKAALKAFNRKYPPGQK